MTINISRIEKVTTQLRRFRDSGNGFGIIGWALTTAMLITPIAQVPKLISDTVRPVRPNVLYFIAFPHAIIRLTYSHLT